MTRISDTTNDAITTTAEAAYLEAVENERKAREEWKKVRGRILREREDHEGSTKERTAARREAVARLEAEEEGLRAEVSAATVSRLEAHLRMVGEEQDGHRDALGPLVRERDALREECNRVMGELGRVDGKVAYLRHLGEEAGMEAWRLEDSIRRLRDDHGLAVRSGSSVVETFPLPIEAAGGDSES